MPEKNEKKAKDIVIELECTLEELYNGCVKNVKYNRKKVSSDSITLEDVEDSIDVEILRGYDKNSVIRFKDSLECYINTEDEVAGCRCVITYDRHSVTTE